MIFKDLFRKKSVAQILKNAEQESLHGGGNLHKTLGVRDLTAFGIAAIIGAGIFSTIGKASFDGGPGVILLFIFTAIACSFAALAYAEFASLVPVSGSAYTYSYVAFGELFAWIIGWALIMEYAIGNITVAISWSDYFTSLFNSIKIGGHFWHMPEWMTMDYFTAHNGFDKISKMLSDGQTMQSITAVKDNANDILSYLAWTGAPTIGGFHLVLDIPAISIIILITALVYRGMQETRIASNIMVGIKLTVVLMVIIFGAMYVDTSNWHPFMPNGVGGLLKGISAVFFAYIGFDAISTTAEECKNPQRDLPRSIIYSIIICTILYVTIALVITGMVSYKGLNVGDPLAFVFEKFNQLAWLKNIIAVSAVIAMASVLLVFQMGQPRIWLTMSRDGLLPKQFSRIHKKFRTPSFATIVTGFLVAIPTFFLNINQVTDVCSLGTLFAFVLVCAGVLKMDSDPNGPRGKFRVPYVNSRFIVPVLLVAGALLTWNYNRDNVIDFTHSREVFTTDTLVKRMDINEQATLRSELTKLTVASPKLFDTTVNRNGKIMIDSISNVDFLHALNANNYVGFIQHLPVNDSTKYDSGWKILGANIPMWIFFLVCLFITYRCFNKKLSLIPVLGLMSCLYMMSQLGWKNWTLFTIWLLVGLSIYFLYSRYHSKMNLEQEAELTQNG